MVDRRGIASDGRYFRRSNNPGQRDLVEVRSKTTPIPSIPWIYASNRGMHRRADRYTRGQFRRLDGRNQVADGLSILDATFFSVAIFGFITGFPERFWRPCWIAATSCLAAFSVLLSLGFNHFQIGVTRDERSFFEQLRKIVEHDRTTGVAFPRQYIIRLDNPAYFLPQGNFLPKSYAETLLGHDVTFQAADALPASSEEETMLIWKDQRLVRSKGLTKSPTSR